MTENSIILQDMEFAAGDFKTPCEIINGREEDQWIEFSSNGIPVVVTFDCEVDGYLDKCPGDFWTPPHSETVIEKCNIYITGFSIDDAEIEVCGNLEKALKELVKNKIDK